MTNKSENLLDRLTSRKFGLTIGSIAGIPTVGELAGLSERIQLAMIGVAALFVLMEGIRDALAAKSTTVIKLRAALDDSNAKLAAWVKWGKDNKAAVDAINAGRTTP